MAGVRKWIATHHPDCAIAQRSFYDRRQERFLAYRELLDAWILVFDIRKRTPEDSTLEEPIGLISHSELCSIQDRVLRHKIAYLNENYRNLENQLRMTREISNLPVVSLRSRPGQSRSQNSEFTPPATDLSVFDIAEIEALNDFLNPGRMKRRGISFTKEGRLQISPNPKVAIVSGVAFEFAIQKICALLGNK